MRVSEWEWELVSEWLRSSEIKWDHVRSSKIMWDQVRSSEIKWEWLIVNESEWEWVSEYWYWKTNFPLSFHQKSKLSSSYPWFCKGRQSPWLHTKGWMEANSGRMKEKCNPRLVLTSSASSYARYWAFSCPSRTHRLWSRQHRWWWEVGHTGRWHWQECSWKWR